MHSKKEQLNEYQRVGLEAVGAGEVSFLILAGGQGTRLGVSYSEGMLVGLMFNKTLFQREDDRFIQTPQLADKLNQARNDNVKWYIRSPEHTKEQSFAQHKYFCLDENDINFFEQEMLQYLFKEGKIFLDEKWKLNRAPDGKWVLYKALTKHKIIDQILANGIKYVNKKN